MLFAALLSACFQNKTRTCNLNCPPKAIFVVRFGTILSVFFTFCNYFFVFFNYFKGMSYELIKSFNNIFKFFHVQLLKNEGNYLYGKCEGYNFLYSEIFKLALSFFVSKILNWEIFFEKKIKAILQIYFYTDISKKFLNLNIKNIFFPFFFKYTQLINHRDGHCL